MRKRATCAVLVLAAATAGCATAGDSADSAAPTSAAPTSAAPTSAAGSSAPSWAGWDEPAEYRFTVESSCGERNFSGVYRVTVRGGEVVAADHDDRSTGDTVTLGPDELRDVPTLGDMLDEALRATGDPAAGEIEVVTDPADGHPRWVSVDHLESAIDDESCYAVTDYRPGA